MLVDDHPIFRWGVRQFIADLPDYAVVGEASNGLDALNKVKDLRPQVIILDLEMPGLSGVELLTEIKREALIQPQVLIISQSSSVDLCHKLHQLGINGYILKTDGVDEIGKALEHVAKGGTYFSPHIAQKLWGFVQEPSAASPAAVVSDKPAHDLSQREMQVAQLVTQGLSNRQIAEQIGCSASTVKSHRANLMRKIGAKSLDDVSRWTQLHKSKSS